MYLDKIADATEQACVSQEIINAFASRGWALYEMNVEKAYSLAEIKSFVEFGRARDFLELNTSYIMLPLVQEEDEANGDYVIEAAQNCIQRGRFPRYADFKYVEGAGIGPVCTGVVDSIKLVPGFLEIHFESRMPHFGIQGGCVQIPLAIAAAKIFYGVPMAYKEDKNVQNKIS